MKSTIAVIFLCPLVSGFTFRNHGIVNTRGQLSSPTSIQMGIFDDLKLIFSEEGKKNRQAYDDKVKEEQEEALRKVRERRLNPKKMEEYEAEVRAKRIQLAKERQAYDDFQLKEGAEYDPLEDWKKGREEGTVVLGDDLERDPTSERLGSEGLQDVRVDERMPYIDRGYVDEDADVFGNIQKIFGGNKKD